MSFFDKNKQTIIGTLVVLLIFGAIKFYRHNELKNDSITVEGNIIECKFVKLSGACVVKIEFKTNEGVYRTSTNTLYMDTNCRVGKRVKIQYSTVSDLTNVIE